MVYNRNAVVHVLIHIRDIRDFIDGVVVVDVCDLNIGHAGVGHVYVLNVARAGVVPRNVNLSRSKRKPSHRFGAYANSDGESAATDKRDQGRRINRSNCNRPWHPAPAISGISPAAIVERRKSPRLVFNPRPSPGINISPMTVAIWRPVSGDASRLPNISVFRIGAPAAIIVQVLVAGHIRGNVLAAAGAVFTPVAGKRPLSEGVRILNSADVVAELINA
jgi:hypothetical protein